MLFAPEPRLFAPKGLSLALSLSEIMGSFSDKSSVVGYVQTIDNRVESSTYTMTEGLELECEEVFTIRRCS